MRLFLGVLFAAALLLTPRAARAQYRGVPTSPRVSPYLNLLRGGSPPGVNYYDLVRPQIETRNSLQALSQQSQLNQQAIAGLESGVLTTGHTFGFQNHGSYFNNLGTGGAGVGLGQSFAGPQGGAGSPALRQGGFAQQRPSASGGGARR